MSPFMALVKQMRAKGATALHFECQLGDWLDKLDQGNAEWEVWTCRCFGVDSHVYKGVGRSGEEALRRCLANLPEDRGA